MAHFVLVHGAWHGAWCWRHVTEALIRAGHRAHAVTLTGLGERAHLLSPAITLETHIADVIGVIEAEELDDVVLAVHSYAGMLGTAVADRLPQRLAHLVYVDAVVPKPGESWSSTHARATREAAQRFAALGLPVEVTVHARHPATKRDAPSATARELGARAGGSPDLLSTRSGGPVSDHSVRFSTAAASYELTHSVRDLRLSAEGALLLAGRLLGRPAGLYTTDDLYSEIAGEAKGTSR